MGQYSKVLDYGIEEFSQLGLVSEDDKEVSLTEEGLRGQAKAHKGVGKFSEILGFSISDILGEVKDLKELRGAQRRRAPAPNLQDFSRVHGELCRKGRAREEEGEDSRKSLH